MVLRISIAMVFGLMTASGVIAQSQPAKPLTAGNAEAGKRAYAEQACFYCHGTVGQGSLPAVGPRIARVPRSLESFTAYVRRPSGRMSAYSDALVSDAALADIYAYLHSLPAPAAERPALFERLKKH